MQLASFISEYPVNIEFSIQWGDMDAFRHLNNVTYFRYFENIRIEHFELAGINQLMAEKNIGPILGQTQCKYLFPLSWPDRVTVGTRVTTIRPKRFTMEYAIWSHQHQQLAANGSGEIVYFDYQQNHSCFVPESIVENIKRLNQSTKD